MAIKIVKVLVGTVALGALIGLGTELGVARPGGGGGGHFGGSAGHFGGGPHFGGGVGRFGGAHIQGFGGARMGASRFSGIRSAHVRGLSTHGFSNQGKNSAHINSIAHNGVSHVRALGAAGTLGGHAGWNHWGNPYWRTGWNGGWGGWYGPVFWPYFYGNLLAFVLWPYGWFDPLWAYGDMFVWDAIFWPGPYYGYAYGPPYYDVYGDYGYYRGYARTRGARAHYVEREITGSTINGSDLTQTCGGLAPGVTDLPIEHLEKTIQLTDEQLKVLDTLKTASSQASDVLKVSCSSEVPLTPLGRLDTVQRRLDAMVQAMGIVRAPLDNFYNSLNKEQRQRFAALAPVASARTSRGGSVSSNDLAALCSRRTESFTQLPVQRIEQVIKPTQQQQDAFDKLKAASTEAANQLQASCPAELPQAPIERFDAVGKRLDAMTAAIKTVRPALASFYDSLTDEQKARFNTLGPPQTTASRKG